MPEINTTDADDPRVAEAVRAMVADLSRYVRLGERLSSGLIDRLEGIIADHRASFKVMHGYDLPELAPLVLPSIGLVVFYRRDVEDLEIHRKMVQLLRQLYANGLRPSAIEMAAAIQRVWPKYRPPVEDWRKDPKTKGKGRVLV